MADADLDVVIRKLAKTTAQDSDGGRQEQRDRYAALAAKAKDADARKQLKQIAKDALEIGTATVKRLQMSADNAAYSYARAIRQAAEAARPAKDAPSKKRASSAKNTAPPAKKAVKTTKA